MKIALIESKLNGIGGSQRQALSFAVAFQELGHEVTVYTINYDHDKCFPDLLDQLRIVTLPDALKPSRTKKRRLLGFLNYVAYAKEENKAARALACLIDPKTDILNPHDRLGFRVAAYYKKLIKNTPSVLMMSDILTKSWIAWRRSQFDSRYRPTFKQKLFNWVVDFYEVRYFIKPHEGMAVLDERTKEWAREYFGKDAVVVRSGLDIQKFPFISNKKITADGARILMAGIFFVHRRYEDAIQAIKILSDKRYDATLTIVGGYTSNNEYLSYHERLRALVSELGIEKRVVFLGHISEDELRENYASHDIYVSPNHLQSWGLACFEAMASGLPVIVSKTAGAAEVLTDGLNALLVVPKSPEEIAAAIARLIDSPELYEHMSVEGRAFVEKNISWKQSAQAMLKVFRDC